MKKKMIIMLAAAVALPLVSCKKKEKSVEHAPASIDVAAAVEDSVVLHKTYPGYLSSNLNVGVVAQVDGRLLKKCYESGSFVKKGQLLFTIDPTLYRDEVDRAEAALASAISARNYAASHNEAVKKALESDAVSKMEALQAESNLEQAEAQIKTCRSQLNTAKTNLGYCTVTAPISGFISDSEISEGNYLSGSASPVELCRIYDNSKMIATFEIEDAQYEKMVGRTSGISSPLYRNVPLNFRDKLLHNYSADLTYEAPSVALSTGTVLLKGDVRSIDNELKDGMYVTVDLPYGVDPHAVLVKDASIGTDQLGKYVYLVNDSNKVVYTHVEVGELYQDSLRIITSGVRKGDLYVTKALLTVRNGETVNPVKNN